MLQFNSSLLRIVVFANLVLIHIIGKAQFPYSETFRNNTATGFIFDGTPKTAFLTSGVVDPPGDGYLRLTDSSHNQSGIAFCSRSFRSNQGLIIEFEYFMHDGIPVNSNPLFPTGDGLTFFLYDASVPSSDFHAGAFGGSLGYAQKTPPAANPAIPGVRKGYIGIGFDAIGNFSLGTEGRVGGTGQVDTSAVVIRGPGEGLAATLATDYPWVVTQRTIALPTYFRITDTTQGRSVLPTSTGYRKARIEMNPIITAGIVTGYQVTVKITVGGASPVQYTVLNNVPYNYVPPPDLKFGFTAGTGAGTNFHEIRNLVITPLQLLSPPVAVDDTIIICQRANVYLDITANDLTPNGTTPFLPGVDIDRTSVDFDTIADGFQKTMIIPGQGTFIADDSGIVSFTPDPSFTTGSVSTEYFINDVYGQRNVSPGVITITIGIDQASLLSVNSPQTACAPATVNITSPTVWSASPGGGTVVYFKNAMATNPVINPMAIDSSGIYYIRYTGVNGCVTTAPVEVTITPDPPDPPFAPDTVLCAPGIATLKANGANAGEIYRWYDSPAGGTLLAESADGTYTTPTIVSTTTFWVSKYNSAGAGCESAVRDSAKVTITAGPTGVNAGFDQHLGNITSIVLNGSVPDFAASESGLWKLLPGAYTATIVNPENYNAQVINITPNSSYSFVWTVQRGSCILTDTVNYAFGIPLPVTLINFNGNIKDRKALLRWTTVSETDNEGFEIERSMNGINFIKIRFINGTGNSQQRINYQYEDNIASINAEKIFYRLKQIDPAGEFNYSRTIVLRNNNDGPAIQFLPNPFTTEINLSARLNSDGRITIHFIETSGRLAYKTDLVLSRGMNNISIPFPETLPRGIYFADVRKDNERLGVFKITRQ